MGAGAILTIVAGVIGVVLALIWATNFRQLVHRVPKPNRLERRRNEQAKKRAEAKHDEF